MEVDIMMVNGDSVALIEVKNRIHPDFVTEFAQERVRKFRTLYPIYDNYKLYLGIAGFSFDTKVTEKAKENGVGIVKQVGEGIELEVENLKAY
jgi:Holliday junction resolvase-like predicted endonuclease